MSDDEFDETQFEFGPIAAAVVRAHPEYSDQDVAIAVMSTAENYEELMEFMLKLATREIWHIRRRTLRLVEARAEGALADARANPVAIASGNWAIPAELKRLQLETFPLGNGQRVRWGEATVEQHQERVDRQRQLMGSIGRDMNRHIVAIEVIQAAGVTCLDDLENLRKEA